MKYYLALLILSSILLSNCQKQDEFTPLFSSLNSDIYVEVKVQENSSNEAEVVRYTVEKTTSTNGYRNWSSNVYTDDYGNTLIGGFYDDRSYHEIPATEFGVQFWSDEYPADTRYWSKEQLEELFAPGTTFEFGKGPDKVGMYLRLPSKTPYEFIQANSFSLASPEGSLTINAIEDYQHATYYHGNSSGYVYGKLIHCTFSGQLGIPIDGSVKSINVTEGKAALLFNYE